MYEKEGHGPLFSLAIYYSFKSRVRKQLTPLLLYNSKNQKTSVLPTNKA